MECWFHDPPLHYSNSPGYFNISFAFGINFWSKP